MKQNGKKECQFKSLIRKYKEEDLTVRDKMIDDYMSTAEKIAEYYFGLGTPDEDLIQAAYEGLVGAVAECLEKEKSNYSSFVRVKIERAVRRELAVNRKRGEEPFNRTEITVLQEKRTLTLELGREPSAEEISERLGCSVDLILKVMSELDAKRDLSIERDSYTELLPANYWIADPESQVLEKCDRELIRSYVRSASLSPTQRKYVEWILAGGIKTKEIKTLLGISYSRLHNIKRDIKPRLFKIQQEFIDQGGYVKATVLDDENIEGEKVLKHKIMRDRQNNKHRY